MLDKQSTSSLLRSQQRMKERSPSQEFSCLVFLSLSLFQVEAGEVDSPLIQVDSLLSACQSSKVYRLLGSCFFRGSCLVHQSDFDRKMREEWNERVNEEREREERCHHRKQFLSLFPVTYDDDGCLLSFWQWREKKGFREKRCGKERRGELTCLWFFGLEVLLLLFEAAKENSPKPSPPPLLETPSFILSLSLYLKDIDLSRGSDFTINTDRLEMMKKGPKGRRKLTEEEKGKKKIKKRDEVFETLFEKSISADVSSSSPFSWLFLDVSLIHFSRFHHHSLKTASDLTLVCFELPISLFGRHSLHASLLLLHLEKEEENARGNLWDFSLNPQREEDQILPSYRSIRGITFFSSHSMHIQR